MFHFKPHFLLALAVAAMCAPGCRAQNAPVNIKAATNNSNLVASWNFENSLAPTFARDGWSAQATFAPGDGKPRFVAGHRGQGLVLEEPGRNLLSPAAASLFDDAKPFAVRGGAKISLDKSGALSGTNALKIETPGQNIGEGFAVPFARPDAASGLAGEVSLKGKGRLRARLFDPDNYVVGPSVYLELTPEWKPYVLPPLDFAPGGTGDLQLIVETADKTATTFYADQIGVEPNPYATSWLPGGQARGAEKVSYRFGEGASELKEGTLLMWVKFLWNEDTTLDYEGGEGRDVQRQFVDSGSRGIELKWSKYNQLRMNTNSIGGIETLDGKWHLLGVAWSDKKSEIFADDKSSDRSGAVSLDPKKSLVFGPYANAIIDDVMLFDKAMTAAQVEKIWQEGN